MTGTHRFTEYHGEVETREVDVQEEVLRLLCLRLGRGLAGTCFEDAQITHSVDLSHLAEGERVKPVRLGHVAALVLLDELES